LQARKKTKRRQKRTTTRTPMYRIKKSLTTMEGLKTSR